MIILLIIIIRLLRTFRLRFFLVPLLLVLLSLMMRLIVCFGNLFGLLYSCTFLLVLRNILVIILVGLLLVILLFQPLVHSILILIVLTLIVISLWLCWRRIMLFFVSMVMLMLPIPPILPMSPVLPILPVLLPTFSLILLPSSCCLMLGLLPITDIDILLQIIVKLIILFLVVRVFQCFLHFPKLKIPFCCLTRHISQQMQLSITWLYFHLGSLIMLYFHWFCPDRLFLWGYLLLGLLWCIGLHGVVFEINIIKVSFKVIYSCYFHLTISYTLPSHPIFMQKGY